MPYIPYSDQDTATIPQPMQGVGVPPPATRRLVGARRPGMPVPPIPVMPPEGIAPVTDPASTGTAPDASPTTMVLQYLKSRGYQPTSENVRRALEANARDPGVIPGLRSSTASTEAEDQAAMAAAGRGGGGRGLPVPPIPPSDGAPNTSAAPTTGSGTGGVGGSPDASGISNLILGIGGAGLGAGALYGADRYLNRAGPTPPGAPGEPQLRLPPPDGGGGGGGGGGGPPSPQGPMPPDQPLMLTHEPTTPVQDAITKALQPALGSDMVAPGPVVPPAPTAPPVAQELPPRTPTEQAAYDASRTSPDLRTPPPAAAKRVPARITPNSLADVLTTAGRVVRRR